MPIIYPLSTEEIEKCLFPFNKEKIIQNYNDIMLSILETINYDLQNQSSNDIKNILNNINIKKLHPQLENIVSFYALKNKYNETKIEKDKNKKSHKVA